MSLISRLRAVVAGDEYLDGDYDDLDYDTGEELEADHGASHAIGGALAPLDSGNPFGDSEPFSSSSSNVIGMPGISTNAAEVTLMEPRSFDEMPRAIQALRERNTVILNLTMMEPDQAQRAVDFVAAAPSPLMVTRSEWVKAFSCLLPVASRSPMPARTRLLPPPW